MLTIQVAPLTDAWSSYLKIRNGSECMKSFTIHESEALQRIDKYALKILNKAPKSFVYKMFRKKNIKLNGAKIEGTEVLQPGDVIEVFFTDETFAEFSDIDLTKFVQKETPVSAREDNKRPTRTRPVRSKDPNALKIVYEDNHILVLNKPVGVLSQPDGEGINLVEQIEKYLKDQVMGTFKPGICNRLDRNTSGIVIAGKDIATLQVLNEAIKNHHVKKSYRCLALNAFKQEERGRHLVHYWQKDERNNKVSVTDNPPTKGDYDKVETRVEVITQRNGYVLLEVQIITGKSHQIRAQLAAVGHPVAGDNKYGNRKINSDLKKHHGLENHLLHAYNYTFRDLPSGWTYLNDKTFQAPMPQEFEMLANKLMK